MRLLATAGGGLEGVAELKTQAVLEGVLVPPMLDVTDDRDEMLLFEDESSGSLGTGGAGLAGGGTILGPFVIRPALVALPIAVACPFAEPKLFRFPFDSTFTSRFVFISFTKVEREEVRWVVPEFLGSSGG